MNEIHIYRKETRHTLKIFKCTFCNTKCNKIWTNKKETISCCIYCWGNNPLVARATEGNKFKHNKTLKL